MVANKALYDAAQARVHELTGLAEVARLITVARPISETLDALSLQVCGLVGCKAAAIYVPGSSPGEALWGSSGLPEGFAALVSSAMVAPPTDGMPLASQAAYLTGQPAWRPLDREGTAFSAYFAAAGRQGWGAATAVPLRLQDRTIGAVACYTTEPAPLPAPQMSILTTVAGQVAVAVENARLSAQAQDAAVLEERQRLSRELHDSVSQALYGIALGSKTARIMAERDPTQVIAPLDYVVSLAHTGLAEMRALILELRPEMLEQEGLVAVLQKQADATTARHPIRVTTELCGEPDVPLTAKEVLYRIAQEALHNTVKHAAATEVRLSLVKGGEEIILAVHDNGKGFDTTGSFPGHLGLHSMRERVERFGGTLELKSTVGKGTIVSVQLPLRST
jgi:signal transduction histidine kinase